MINFDLMWSPEFVKGMLSHAIMYKKKSELCYIRSDLHHLWLPYIYIYTQDSEKS